MYFVITLIICYYFDSVDFLIPEHFYVAFSSTYWRLFRKVPACSRNVAFYKNNSSLKHAKKGNFLWLDKKFIWKGSSSQLIFPAWGNEFSLFLARSAKIVSIIMLQGHPTGDGRPWKMVSFASIMRTAPDLFYMNFLDSYKNKILLGRMWIKNVRVRTSQLFTFASCGKNQAAHGWSCTALGRCPFLECRVADM